MITLILTPRPVYAKKILLGLLAVVLPHSVILFFSNIHRKTPSGINIIFAQQ